MCSALLVPLRERGRFGRSERASQFPERLTFDRVQYDDELGRARAKLGALIRSWEEPVLRARVATALLWIGRGLPVAWIVGYVIARLNKAEWLAAPLVNDLPDHPIFFTVSMLSIPAGFALPLALLPFGSGVWAKPDVNNEWHIRTLLRTRTIDATNLKERKLPMSLLLVWDQRRRWALVGTSGLWDTTEHTSQEGMVGFVISALLAVIGFAAMCLLFVLPFREIM